MLVIFLEACQHAPARARRAVLPVDLRERRTLQRARGPGAAMPILFHIASRTDWDAASAAGVYRPASLDSEGFIHCSTAAQVVGSADRYFRGRGDLVLLCIDEARVAGALRHEPPAVIGGAPDSRASELFPHLHGPLALDAVIRVVPFPCRADGSFALPLEAGG
jgi:uncharacterized protein (DUF952 family)